MKVLFNKHKICQHSDTEDNTIPTEHLEIVLLDEAHQETDDEQRGHERGDCADAEDHQLGGCKRKAKLENLEQACAEHDRNGQKERKLRSHGDTPSSSAPTMVAPEREVPGNTAAISWNIPIINTVG